MRRYKKEITQKSEIEQIINNSEVCRIGMCLNNIPYIIPISYGFDSENLYLHTAEEGRKIEFWEANPNVCFEFDIDVKTIESKDKACKWSADFKSVIGYGQISELKTFNEKIYGLNKIMHHYSKQEWKFTEDDIKNVRVWKIEITELTGKKST